MPAPRPARLAPEWDERFTRMVGVSAVGHLLTVVLLLIVAQRSGPRPLPMVAYTVEITDPSAIGGRIPPGAPAADLGGGATQPPSPEPKPAAPEPPAPAPVAEATPREPPKPPEPKAEEKPPEPPKPPEPKAEEKPPEPPPPEEPEVRLPDKTPPPTEPPKRVEPPKHVEPPKPPPKPEVAKPEPPKPEPAKPVAAKPPPPKAEPKPEAKPATPAHGGGGPAQDAPPKDAYAAAAERWRSRTGGGLGGTDEGSGPIGTGGPGKGGGGQLVGLEFLAYRQQVINTIKAQWTNVIARPGLMAAVRFAIAPDGEVSDVRLAQSSGNGAYDASALRAVQHVTKLPPPPARYANEFRDFQIEFHSEDKGGEGTG